MTLPIHSDAERRKRARVTLAALLGVGVLALATPFLVRWRINTATRVPSGGAVYASPPYGWRFVMPVSWSERVKEVRPQARPGEPPWRDAMQFVYAPLDTQIVTQVLLRLTVYDDTVWVRMSAQDGPPVGEAVAVQSHLVYVASLPQSNPYASGSPDAAQFGRMSLTIDGVKQGLALTPSGR